MASGFRILKLVNSCDRQIDLTIRPSKLEANGRELASVIAAIRRAGAYPAGMEHPRPGCYVVRIDWPEPLLFAPAVRQSVQGVPIPIQ